MMMKSHESYFKDCQWMFRLKTTRKLSVPMLVRTACSANALVLFLGRGSIRSARTKSVS